MCSFSVNKEDHLSIQMAQRMFHESGEDGRSGEVQEKDFVTTFGGLSVQKCSLTSAFLYNYSSVEVYPKHSPLKRLNLRLNKQ